MVIDLVGILDDGSAYAPGIPLNPRKQLNIPKGGDVTIRLSVFTPNGEAVSLASPVALVLTVKNRPEDSAIFSRTPTVVGTVASFAITPADMRQQEAGFYVYDIWLTDSGGKTNPVVPLSPLQLQAASRAVP